MTWDLLPTHALLAKTLGCITMVVLLFVVGGALYLFDCLLIPEEILNAGQKKIHIDNLSLGSNIDEEELWWPNANYHTTQFWSTRSLQYK